MRSILFIFNFCLFAPLQIDGTGERLIQKAIEEHGESVTMILDKSKSGQTINGVLKLLENGLLGSGGGGIVFRGFRLEDKKPVAIKFVNNKNKAKREYEAYSYLSAIHEPKVEKYGIPTVYYYGEWENWTVTAFTELDKTLKGQRKITEFQSYDYLFLIRHFIKQSKYIHSHGIRHDDIKPANILIRDCESFLNDFDYASKMKEDNHGRTPKFASLRLHEKKPRVPMDDWESYLYTLCYHLEIPLDWFHKDMKNAMKNDKKTTYKLFKKLKKKRTKILNTIERELQERVILKDVLLAFAAEAFSEKEMPDYDGLNKLVNDNLKQHFPDKTCFSWITESMINNSSNCKKIKESIKRANTKIGDIVIPGHFSEYEYFRYPQVDEEFFKKKNHRLNWFFGCTSRPCV